MTTTAEIRYVYRHRPVDKFIYWRCFGVMPMGVAYFLRDTPEFAWVFVVVGIVPVVCALFLRTRAFVVTGEGLLVIKRPFIRLFGTYDFFAAGDIRHIRYWSEIRDVSDSDHTWHETWYYLDLLTRDGTRVVLLEDRINQIDPKLWKRLAEKLGVAYEEYLA